MTKGRLSLIIINTSTQEKLKVGDFNVSEIVDLCKRLRSAYRGENNFTEIHLSDFGCEILGEYVHNRDIYRDKLYLLSLLEEGLQI